MKAPLPANMKRRRSQAIIANRALLERCLAGEDPVTLKPFRGIVKAGLAVWLEEGWVVWERHTCTSEAIRHRLDDLYLEFRR